MIIKKDIEKAIHYFETAADMGNSDAQVNTALMYYSMHQIK